MDIHRHNAKKLRLPVYARYLRIPKPIAAENKEEKNAGMKVLSDIEVLEQVLANGAGISLLSDAVQKIIS